MLGAVRDDDIGGGLIPVQNWYAPSLTSSRETGLGDWEMKDIVDLLRTGVSARGAVFGPMAAVVQHSLQNVDRRRPDRDGRLSQGAGGESGAGRSRAGAADASSRPARC